MPDRPRVTSGRSESSHNGGSAVNAGTPEPGGSSASKKFAHVEVVDAGEPLLIWTYDGDALCEGNHGTSRECRARPRWYVETAMSADAGDRYLPFVRYACNRHLAALGAELLHVRTERRRVR